MKKIIALALVSIGLISCKKETKTITKIDPTTGKSVSVEVPVTDSLKEAEAAPAIYEENGVYKQSFKLEKGKTYPLKTVTKETQTVTDPTGKSASASSLSEDNMSFTVLDFTNGIYNITINLIGKKVSQTVQGQTITVDTNQPAPKDKNQKMMWTVNKAFSGNQLNLKMDVNGNIQSVTGFDVIYNKINRSIDGVITNAKDKKAFVDSFKETFNENVIKEQFTKNIHLIPVNGVKIGEKWTDSVNASQDGKIKFTTNYVLENVDNASANIKIVGGIPKQSNKQTQEGYTQTMSSELNQNGNAKFDVKTGWLITQNMTMKTTEKRSITDGKETQSMSSVTVSNISINP